MASTYPGTLDTITDLSTTLNGPPTHSSNHTKLKDCIIAIETELGTDPAGASATVAARLTAIESSVTSEASSRATGDSTNATAAANAAQGLLDLQTTSTTVNFTGSVADCGLSTTFTAQANRYYRIRGTVNMRCSSAAGASGRLYLTDGSGTAIRSVRVYLADNGESRQHVVEWVGTLSAGSTTRKLRADGSNYSLITTAESSTAYAELTVEDLGAV